MKNKKNLTISEFELPIEMTQDEGGYVARCSIWNDCYAQAESLEEAITEITHVASALIELYKVEGLKIPLKLNKTAAQSANRLSFTVPVIVSGS